MDYSADPVRCYCKSQKDAAQRKARLMQYCELPRGSENQTFATWVHYPDLEDAFTAATQLAKGDGFLDWLTLCSPTDRGKSHLAMAVVRAWLDRGVPAKFIFVPDALDWLKAAFNQRNDDTVPSYEGRMNVLKTTPLLVLDDLGAEKATEWTAEVLGAIINHRYANHLPLMVTTNKPVDHLPGDPEGRIGSRLKRYVPGRVIDFASVSFRIRASK